MNIYISHSSAYNYTDELYKPLKHSELWSSHTFFLPHDADMETVHSKEVITHSNLFVAEVSLPSTGQGIELAWAHDAGIPMLCVYKEGTRPTSALAFLNCTPVKYSSIAELIDLIQEKLK